MKQTLLVFSFAALAACSNQASVRSFEVEGTVRNAAAKMIYLEENVPNGQPTIMDSSEIKSDGGFHLQSPSREEALYHLRLAGQSAPFALLISDVPKLTVKADLANAAQPYSVSGSKASEALLTFDRELYDRGTMVDAAGRKWDSLRTAKAPDSIVTAQYAQVEESAAALKGYAYDFLSKSNSPVLTLYALSSFQNTSSNLRIPGFNQTELRQQVQSAAEKFPQHAALQSVVKGMAPAKAPEFSQPGVDGKPVSLSSFRGKYVLLDFWASWCQPCRMDNPNVVRAYNEFKDKNFTVFGVSLDRSRDAWQQAIQQDGLTWTHASDLKFWSNEAAALYGVQAIPANFLIDPQGNIIAQDLHGEEIVQTLRKVIK